MSPSHRPDDATVPQASRAEGARWLRPLTRPSPPDLRCPESDPRLWVVRWLNAPWRRPPQAPGGAAGSEETLRASDFVDTEATWRML